MMTDENIKSNMSTSSGLALGTLLRNAQPVHVRQLIGHSVTAVLDELDCRSSIGEFAAQFLEPADALSDPARREKIIHIMPQPKARELAKCLGVSIGRDLYHDLVVVAGRSSSRSKLLSFFGATREERAPGNPKPNVSLVRASYPLYNFQREVSERVFHALSSEPHKVVLHMPTGAGKTRTAMHIVSTYLKHNAPTVVCWLASNVELLDQAASEFCEAWSFLGNRELKIAQFWGQQTPDIISIRDGIVVASLGKMVALDKRDPATFLEFADNTTLTVIDEAHQAVAPTFSTILKTLHVKRPKNKLLGLTATPGRSYSNIAEDKELSSFFGDSKVTIGVNKKVDPIDFLIENQYLAKPIFRTLDSEAEIELSGKDVSKLNSTDEIPEDILARLGNDARRNVRILRKIDDLSLRHKRIIVFTPSVESARLVAAISTSRGKEAHVITGLTPLYQRERIVKRFKSNSDHTIVLTNYGIVTAGFDAPKTSAVIIARPTRSLVLYSQMVGRAVRGLQAGGNAEAEIVTVVDSRLPGFGSIAEAFANWEDVWNESG